MKTNMQKRVAKLRKLMAKGKTFVFRPKDIGDLNQFEIAIKRVGIATNPEWHPELVKASLGTDIITSFGKYKNDPGFWPWVAVYAPVRIIDQNGFVLNKPAKFVAELHNHSCGFKSSSL